MTSLFEKYTDTISEKRESLKFRIIDKKKVLYFIIIFITVILLILLFKLCIKC